MHVWGQGAIWEPSVLSSQFCQKSKTALKSLKKVDYLNTKLHLAINLGTLEKSNQI